MSNFSAPVVTAGLAAIGAVPADVAFATSANTALLNGEIVASVASNALTIAIKNLAGDDPSATNPVYVGFRTLDGSFVIRSITAATSMVVSEGSRIRANVSPDQCQRLWVVAFDDTSAVALAVINCGGGGISPLNESGVASTTAEGGAGGADSVGVFYSSSAISNKPFRVVGFLEWSTPIAVAGEWANEPDTIHLAGAGTKFPGDVVQVVVAGASQYTSGSADIPFDDTAPSASEGELVASAPFTPTSPCNTVVLEFVTFGARSTAGTVIAYIIEASALEGVIGVVEAGADKMAMVAARTAAFLNSVTLRTYSLRRGAGGAGATFYGGGDSGGRKFGGGMYSFMQITELAG